LWQWQMFHCFGSVLQHWIGNYTTTMRLKYRLSTLIWGYFDPSIGYKISWNTT
jgi:hypothetical protein